MATNTRPTGAAAAASAPAFDLGGVRAAVGRLPRVPQWLAGAAALAVVVGALVLGTAHSGVFAIRRIAVSGAQPQQAATVERVLRPLLGRSLSSLRRSDVMARLETLPAVSAAAYDRAFPHTLRVFVRTERPIAVARQGARAWLVSAHARVLGSVSPHAHRKLPRIWLPAGTTVRAGSPLRRDAWSGVEAVATAERAGFARRLVSVTISDGELVAGLRSGTQLRLGPPRAVGLKLAIAQRIAPTLAQDGKRYYVDLTVPARPVAGVLQPSSRSSR